MNFRHGELCNFQVDDADGTRVVPMVTVEFSRVTAEHLSDGPIGGIQPLHEEGVYTGWIAVPVTEYRRCFRLEPWDVDAVPEAASRVKH